MQIQSNHDRWDWTRGEVCASEGSHRLDLEPQKIRERDCNTVAVSINPRLDAMIPALFSSYENTPWIYLNSHWSIIIDQWLFVGYSHIRQ